MGTNLGLDPRHGDEVWRVTVAQDGELSGGPPALLFRGNYRSMDRRRFWDVDASGEWFLMVEGAKAFVEYVVVLNWINELQTRVTR